MTLDGIISFAGYGMSIALIAVVWIKRVYKDFPVFSAYLVWDILDNIGLYATARFHPHFYVVAFLTALAIDSVFMLAVLVELGWSILRPFRSALPRGAIVAVAILMGVLCAIVWPFAHSVAYAHYGPQSRLLLHLQQTIAIVRILFFLVLAGCSQLLSINWRDREMQIATGLGIYSLVSVAVSIIQAGQTVGQLYIYLDQLVMATNVCCLMYWLISFARQAAARREFTPQMQNFLLAVAGAARSTRISMTQAGTTQMHDRDK